MADEPLIPAATGAPIVVDTSKPAVAVEQVGARPVVYTGDEELNAPEVDVPLPERIQSALSELFGAPPAAAADLDTVYSQRLEDRQGAALDAETADLEREVADADRADALKAAAGDVVKGVFVEGIPAAIAGAKDAANETLDMIETVADQVPLGVITWGPDGIQAMSGKEAKEKGFANALGNLLPRFKKGPAEDSIDTNTGKFIEKASQFVTGFAGAGKVLKGWTAATRAGTVGKALAQGAIADFAAFDGHEARLSDMLSELTHEQAGPIIEFLASNQDDPELLGRTKNALEGLGLGVGTDAVFRGLKAMRASRLAKQQAKQAAAREGFQTFSDDAGETLADDVEAEIAKLLGSSPQKLTEGQLKQRAVSGKVNAAAKETGAADAGIAERLTEDGTPAAADNVFNLKLDTIETPEDIQRVIARMTKEFAPGVDGARRGVRTWQQTGEAADKLDWVSAMAKRKEGDAANAETVLAYREALNASAAKLLALAQGVQVNPSVAAQYAFRRALATHHAIQLEFMGARAEAGRALNAFKIPAGTPAEKLRQVDALLADTGGAASAEELAKKVLQAAKSGDVALNQLISGGWAARSKAMIKLVYTNGLLSGLGTAGVNIAGNSAAVLMNLAARGLAPRMAGGVSETQAGEATALLFGYMGAMRDAFRLAPKEAAGKITWDAVKERGALRALAPGLDDALPESLRKTQSREEAGVMADMTNKPLSSASWRVDEDSAAGRALDVLQAVIETPSNANMLMDDFFRVLTGRGELRAQAFRQVQREKAAGGLTDAAAKARLAALLEKPSKEMLDAAEREMQELTFTRTTPGMAASFEGLRRAMDNNPTPIPFGSMIMPFIRTPANIISTAMRYSPLAPFMRRFADDIAEGGARAEMAKARMAVGTAMWALFTDMAMNGEITGGGPNNPGQRAALAREDEFGGTGWQPYSVKIGDKWVSYERLDPLGTAMSLAADYSELVANADWDEARRETATQISGHAVAAMGQAFFNKTMLRGVAEYVEAVTSGDDVKGAQFMANRTTGLLPFSSGARMIRRGVDPYLRETVGALDALKNTLPGLSDDLPPARDLWGKPRTYQSGLGTIYDAITPLKVKPQGGAAIDAEILQNGIDVRMPSKTVSIDGENISLRDRPDIYSEFVRLAGEPAYEQLNAVAAGSHPDSAMYFELTDGPDGGKAEYIKDVITAYRKAARAQLLDIYGDDLQRLASAQRLRKQQARDGLE